MIDYTKEFCNYLISCGYPVEKLEIVEKILSRGLSFSGVKVLDDNKKTPTVIQVFALMSDRERQSHHLYPFYRTMNWGETKIKPSCSIATRSRNGSWDIYNAHNSSEKRNSHYPTTIKR